MILIFDGKSLDVILDSNKLTKQFFEVAMLSPYLYVCRCSSLYKSDIVRLFKQFSNEKRIAAVEDRGNDVGMILEVDVGIGIFGKEVMQAALGLFN